MRTHVILFPLDPTITLQPPPPHTHTKKPTPRSCGLASSCSRCCCAPTPPPACGSTWSWLRGSTPRAGCTCAPRTGAGGGGWRLAVVVGWFWWSGGGDGWWWMVVVNGGGGDDIDCIMFLNQLTQWCTGTWHSATVSWSADGWARCGGWLWGFDGAGSGAGYCCCCCLVCLLPAFPSCRQSARSSPHHLPTLFMQTTGHSGWQQGRPLLHPGSWL